MTELTNFIKTYDRLKGQGRSEKEIMEMMGLKNTKFYKLKKQAKQQGHNTFTYNGDDEAIITTTRGEITRRDAEIERLRAIIKEVDNYIEYERLNGLDYRFYSDIKDLL